MAERRAFVVIGQTAVASGEFLAEDLPGTSGRLDVLVRTVRAALLVSHGVRRDTVLYLVLLGGPRAPRCVRFDGAGARFLRPDERSLATLLRKVLAMVGGAASFLEVKPGIGLAEGGLEVVLDELSGAHAWVLEQGGPDLRGALGPGVHAFFLGDHLGFGEVTRARLATFGARPLGVGPLALHTEDVVTIVANEADRLCLPA